MVLLHPRRTAALFLMTLALTACATNSATRAADREAQLVLHVENRSWTDLTIYSVRQGTRTRIGSVSALDTRVFRLPILDSSTGTLRLYAQPLAGEAYLLPEVPVRVQDQVDVILENSIALSSISLRR